MHVAAPFDAVVLAGGSARRLGGIDKPAVLVDGISLLDRVLDAVTTASRRIVVGPQRATRRAVHWTREDPPGGGPVAALAAGLEHVESPLFALLAGDLPFLTSDLVERLRASVSGEGALVVDDDGRPQLLVGLWRTAAVRAALPEQAAGARLSDVLLPLQAALVPPPVNAGRPPGWFDCDTPEDLAVARGIR